MKINFVSGVVGAKRSLENVSKPERDIELETATLLFFHNKQKIYDEAQCSLFSGFKPQNILCTFSPVDG